MESAPQTHIDRAIARAKWQRLALRVPLRRDPLAREASSRQLASLELVNVPAGPVLDLGCGMAQIPSAELARHAVRLDWVGWGGQDVLADACHLPFADGAFAVVWSNMCLPWIGELELFFQQACRVLRPGGLLTVTSLGPDTLAGLRACDPGPTPRTLGFLDMHDLADLVMRAGFAEPVALREEITFSYPDAGAMLDELRVFGALAATGMATHLGQRQALARLRAQAPAQLCFELIYLHAWALPPRPPKVPQMWQGVNFMSGSAGQAGE